MQLSEKWVLKKKKEGLRVGKDLAYAEQLESLWSVLRWKQSSAVVSLGTTSWLMHGSFRTVFSF